MICIPKTFCIYNWASEARLSLTRKDFEIVLGKKKTAKSYRDRMGEIFTVRSSNVSRVH